MKQRSIKSLAMALSLAVFSAGIVAPMAVEAKRLGGGSSAGMQRSTPPPAAAPARPAQATPNAPLAGAAPAAAAKRSWMGPIAGLAAGLGIAALMGHLGLGAGFGNFIMMALLAVAAFFAIRFVMARFGKGGATAGGPALATPNGMRFDRQDPVTPKPAAWGGGGAGAGAGAGAAPAAAAAAAAPVAAAGGAAALPEGFDAAAFERIAKMIFIRMQAANDSGDLNDLRNFTTPEMFAAARLELQERGTTTQTTDVVQIDAQVLEVASETDRQIVSVRFHGLIREEANGVANPFDEVWHLVKPADGSREWAIAGIQQTAAATS